MEPTKKVVNNNNDMDFFYTTSPIETITRLYPDYVIEIIPSDYDLLVKIAQEAMK